MTVWIEEETEVSFPFDHRALAERVAEAVLASERVTERLQVSLLLVDEEAIREMNRDFRQTDRPTDVLSFPMLSFETPGILPGLTAADRAEDGTCLLGDIVLCIPRVRAQAEEYGHSEKREYAFLLAHSMLHLLGYDHMSERERQLMEDKQRQILDQLHIRRTGG